MTTARSGAGVAVIGQRLYAVGGVDGQQRRACSVCTARAPLAQPAWLLPAATQ